MSADTATTDIASLQQEINKLKSLNSKLQSEHDSISQNYNDLLTKHQQLLGSVDDKTNPNPKSASKSASFWDDIYSKCKSNPDAIKELISSGVITMTASNNLDRTLLLISSKKGSYDLVQLCLKLGADIDHKDRGGKTAIDLARDSGFYHIEQLLLFHKLNDQKISAKLKENAFAINKQGGISENINNFLSKYDETTSSFFKDILIDIMTNIIKSKLAFSDLLLNMCWKWEQNETKSDNKLNKIIMQTCTDIINNGNKRDWYWMEKFVLPSTVCTLFLFCRFSDKTTMFLRYGTRKLKRKLMMRRSRKVSKDQIKDWVFINQ